MGRYNLLDEKWIAVIRDNEGGIEKVSLKELFVHTSDYYDLAGEMKTQDFAILRFLLAVLHTVFSRFDGDGNPYDFIEIDDKTYQQRGEVDREELDDEDPFYETWLNLWMKGNFPDIIQEYLEAWREHFYLFDTQFPFYQVTLNEIEELAAGGGQFFGKNLNRTISESNNKIALFSPVAEGEKDKLHNDELARWLIMFQGYTGTGDKKKVRETKSTCSKGWLYDLGGIYLKGHNLFETLMLNCILSVEFDEKYEGDVVKVQIPAWERSSMENVDIYFKQQIDNRATLYTNWARIVSFDNNYDEEKSFSCYIAKLPEVNHTENFLEPMTCWRWNKSGPQKNQFTPRKHRPDESVWRNFNVLMGVSFEENEHQRRPEIISWYHKICESTELSNLKHFKIKICTVSMQDDGNSASWTPVDEINDLIQMETAVLIDDNQDGWIEQINTIVNNTKYRIEQTLIEFLRQVSIIRGYKNDDRRLINKGRERLYQKIDSEFRDWLYEIYKEDSMNEKALGWYDILEQAIREEGETLYKSATLRDLKGIQKEGRTLNISTAFNSFKYNLFVQFHRS